MFSAKQNSSLSRQSIAQSVKGILLSGGVIALIRPGRVAEDRCSFICWNTACDEDIRVKALPDRMIVGLAGNA